MHERQPLLHKPRRPDDRLPLFPILLLAVLRASQAIYFSYIFAWITPFILDNNLAQAETVGRVAGWIESAYSLGFLTGLAPAAVLSDAYGRKPIALIGSLIAAPVAITFGFSTNLATLIFPRFILGFFVSFVPATVVVMMLEMATAKTQPTVLAINSSAWSFGCFVAPFLGGCLAQPAHQFPQLFQHTVWDHYRFALPGVSVAALPLTAVMVAYFVLPETLPAEKRVPVSKLFVKLDANPSAKAALEAEVPAKNAMLRKNVIFILLLWGFYIFNCLSGVVTEVLFLSTAPAVGGLGFGPRDLAILLGLRPLIYNTVVIFIYPRLARAHGTERVLKWSVTVGPGICHVAYFAFGRLNQIDAFERTTALLCMFTMAIPLVIYNLSGIGIFSIVTSRAPSRAYLTKMNTASEYAANIGHGLGALFASNLWSFCVVHDFYKGQGSCLVLLALGLGTAVMAQFVTPQKGWREVEESEEQTDVAIGC